MTRMTALLVICGAIVSAGCAAAPLALDVAAGVVFGTAGIVQRRAQTEEIREMKEEIRRLRQAMGYPSEQTIQTAPRAVDQVAPSLPADALAAVDDIQVP